MKQHYHVLHGMAGLYLPNVNHVATTRKDAWNIAQEELKMDKEAGRKVTKLGKEEWHVQESGMDYTCEIATCHEADCLSSYEASL